MPVFPVMDTVADAELALDAPRAHLQVDFRGQGEEEIIVAAIEEPLDRLELVDGPGLGVVDEIEGGMRPDGFIDNAEFVHRGVGIEFPLVQPGAHRVAAGEEVRVTLRIDGAAAAAHRQAHDGPAPLGPAAAVLLLGPGYQFPEEKILVGAVRHVEIAVLDMADIPVAGTGHDHDHFHSLPRPDEFVQHRLHLPALLPVLIVSIKPVEQVHHRVRLVRPVEPVGNIDIVLDRAPEHDTLQAVPDNLAFRHPRHHHEQRQREKNQTLFHILNDYTTGKDRFFLADSRIIPTFAVLPAPEAGIQTGRLAQLVQSTCLTSRGSTVRIRHLPPPSGVFWF